MCLLYSVFVGGCRCGWLCDVCNKISKSTIFAVIFDLVNNFYFYPKLGTKIKKKSKTIIKTTE